MRKYIPYILFVSIVLLGAVLRLYRIREYMIFLGDEGRDVLVVKRILINHQFTLLGPITSVGSMYTGPIYYYIMAPFLWLWHFDPVGPAIMVALFATATIALIFYITYIYWGITAASAASLLYAVSPLTIMLGRSSWNPNIVPFFSLLIILGLAKTVAENKPVWLLLAGLSFGICLQLHYVSLLMALVVIATLAIKRFRYPIRYFFYLIFGFIITYSPFIIFELRHDFTNTKAVINFVIQSRQVSTGYGGGFIDIVKDVLIRLFWRLIVITDADLTKIFIVLLILGLSIYLFKQKKDTQKLPLGLMIIWLLVGLISFGLYKGVIYDYYFVPLFPLPFILTGIFLGQLTELKKVGSYIAIGACLLLIYFNFQKSPQLTEPNNLLRITETESRFVFSQVDHKPYNFALIAAKNSDHAYRYFLELWGNPPVTIENPVIDPERKSVTSVLYVICEDKVCQPLGHPLWEIAGFGRAQIAKEWHVDAVRIFKLVHLERPT